MLAATPLLVHGIEANIPEYNVALALDKFKIPYEFQVWIRGGRTLRGGLVVDFVVYNPFEQPVEIFGEYWHSGQLGADDRLKLIMEFKQYKKQTIIIWGSEAETPELAENAVRTKL